MLEDGDRTLAAVELLAANGAGRPDPRFLSPEDEERLFEAELAVQDAASHHGAPSVLREVQSMLREQDAAEQEALIQQIAAKIPGGTESVADFRREQRLKAENAARRREIAALPNGRTLLDAEDAVELVRRGALHEDEIDPSGGGFRVNFREGRGARPFELTPDEEALFASPSSEGFISERAIEIYKQRRFNESDLEHLNTLTPEGRIRAGLIAWFEDSPRAVDHDQARALRDGAPLPPFGASIPFLGDIADATGRFAGGVGDVVGDALKREGDRQLAESQFHIDNAERAIDAATAELTRLAEDAGDSGRRFLGELEEIKELDNVEAFERLNQALLGGFTPQLELSPDGIARAVWNPQSLIFDWDRALEGLAGNATYSGSEHLLLRQLPERYREPLGDLLEDALLAAAIGTTAAGIAIASPLSASVTAGVVAGVVVTHAIGVILTDLSEEDSDILELLRAAWEDARQLIENAGLSDSELREVQAQVLSSV